MWLAKRAGRKQGAVVVVDDETGGGDKGGTLVLEWGNGREREGAA